MSKEKKNFMDPHTTTSNKKGVLGKLESAIRTFRLVGFVLMITPILGIYVFCIGFSLSLPIYLLNKVYLEFNQASSFIFVSSLALTAAFSYFLFGLSLIFIVPLVNKILPLKLKPMRTTWYSLEVIPWYYHNALVQLVRYTFLDIITPSPLNILFFKMMGMKIGKNVMINTSNISDPCLITLEDNVTIGGSATIFAHYGMKGFLIVSQTIIKKGVTVGLKASVMGDVIIEEYAMVPPHEVLLPKTRLKAKKKYVKKIKGYNPKNRAKGQLKESA